jgi:hypothetical protein
MNLAFLCLSFLRGNVMISSNLRVFRFYFVSYLSVAVSAESV